MTTESIKEKILKPYMNGEEFMLLGRRIDPYQIESINIYETEESVEEMIKKYTNRDWGKRIVMDKIEGGQMGRRVTERFVTSPPPVRNNILKSKAKKSEFTFDLIGSASFLGLDKNWALATCALQLQEVAVTLTAQKKNIELNKVNVEQLLNRRVESLSFNDQYEAFSSEVKRLFKVDMPILTMHLRRIRVKILHEGYNPEPEEADSIVSFTIGLLKKLKEIMLARARKEELTRKVLSASKEHMRVLGHGSDVEENKKTDVATELWKPLPKIVFKVTQRLLRILTFPQVGWEAYNDSPYQLKVRIEVHPILGGKDLHPLSDDDINGTNVYPVEPRSWLFGNGFFSLPQVCATSKDELILEIRATVEDVNDPEKGEHKLLPSRWKYVRELNVWSYYPQQPRARKCNQ